MKHSKLFDYSMILVFSLVFFLIYYYPTISNYYVVATDTKSHLYFNYNMHDNELFMNDSFFNFLKNNQNLIFYNMVIYLLSFLLPYILLTKWLPLFLITVSTVLLFKLGKKINNRILGYILSLIFWYICFLLNFFRRRLLERLQYP